MTTKLVDTLPNFMKFRLDVPELLQLDRHKQKWHLRRVLSQLVFVVNVPQNPRRYLFVISLRLMRKNYNNVGFWHYRFSPSVKVSTES